MIIRRIYMPKPYYENNSQQKKMTFTGHGQVSVMPDTAVIHLGVETSGENLSSIQQENALRTQSVIQSLNRYGITDIKTFQYIIDKKYDYENGRQIDRGYTVRNILEIRTGAENAGTAVDASVNAGANAVEFISFDVSNRDYYYQQALNLALINAIQKAKSINITLGIRTEPVPVNIVENFSAPVPLQQFSRGVAETPVIPGIIKVEASLTVDFVA
jgi:uncharacterized protein YggE